MSRRSRFLVALRRRSAAEGGYAMVIAITLTSMMMVFTIGMLSTGLHLEQATVKDAGPVPRIPPMRILAGIEAQSERWDGRLEVERVARQDRVAPFETPTDGFTLVNASVAWRPWGRSRESVIVLSANNLFDVEARRHASFTKGFVPMAGRDIRLSARFSF